MRAIFAECDCEWIDRIGCDALKVARVVCETERDGIAAFLKSLSTFHCGHADSFARESCRWPEPRCHFHGERRYSCVCVLGCGHVVGIR